MSLKEVLMFATGADHEPPLGFPTEPIIKFLHADNTTQTSTILFPTANTCAIALSLPCVDNYETFSDFMIWGIVQSPCFGTH